MGAPTSEAARYYVRKAWNEINKDMPPNEYPKPEAVRLKADKLVEEDKKDWIQLPKIRKTRYLCDELKSKYKNRTEYQKSLDKPWFVATMVKHDIPAIPSEALPTVLKMAALFQQSSPNHKGRHMTIREALWAARLSSLAQIKSKPLGKLFKFIQQYAYQELMNELYEGEDYSPAIDAELYYALTGKLFTEPVINDEGNEIVESETLRKIKQGWRNIFAEEQKNMNEEAYPARPYIQDGE